MKKEKRKKFMENLTVDEEKGDNESSKNHNNSPTVTKENNNVQTTKKYNNKWYKLDNSAKIFPPTSKQGRRNIFMMSAIMYDKIKPEILEQATNDILDRFPTYKVRLKRGIFWYYLEENPKPFKVQEEDMNMFTLIDENSTNDYLFRVTYYNNKITICIFHVLTDGMGGVELLKSIIFRYLQLLGLDVKNEGLIKIADAPPSEKETRDSNLFYYNQKNTLKREPDKKAFQMNGTNFDYDGIGLITGKIPMDKLKIETKKYDCTITCYLTAVVIYSIYKAFVENEKVTNKNVCAFLPVNLRKWFNCDTMRNFVGYARILHDYSSPITFDALVKSCKKQMQQKITAENLSRTLNANVKIEKNFWLRIVPLFVKDFVMRIGYKNLGDTLHTISFSNLGNVELPASVKPFVKDIIFIADAGDTKKDTGTVVGYNGFVNVTFARSIVECELERNFFTFFTSLGIDVEIISNYWEKRI